MRVPMIILLSSASIALSACGQINNVTRTSTVSGVNSSSDATNYTPSTSTGTTTTTTTTSGSSTVVSGSTSSTVPTISSSATNGGTQTLAIGNATSFVAPFQADSTLTYQWYKNGSKISGATSSEYDISSISASDYAYYHVIATNSLGTATSMPFYLNPVVFYETLGSHDCNGSQCWNDATTADEVCKMRLGSQSAIYGPYAYGPSGVKWTTNYCTWTGSTWSCQSGCNIYNCTGNNVLGYVYCMQ